MQAQARGGAQNMSFAYLQRRPELVNTTMAFAQQLHMKDEVAHDAILLMDRTMSTSLQVASPLHETATFRPPCAALAVAQARRGCSASTVEEAPLPSA